MEIKINILEIIQSGDFIAFLKGEKYKLREPFANMPTNVSEVIMHINSAIGEGELPVLEQELEEALIFIASNEKYGSWLVLNYLYTYLFKKNRKIVNFSLKTDKLLSTLKSRLKVEKEILFNNNMWVGDNYNHGLWGHVLHLNTLIKEEIKQTVI